MIFPIGHPEPYSGFVVALSASLRTHISSAATELRWAVSGSIFSRVHCRSLRERTTPTNALSIFSDVAPSLHFRFRAHDHLLRFNTLSQWVSTFCSRWRCLCRGANRRNHHRLATRTTSLLSNIRMSSNQGWTTRSRLAVLFPFPFLATSRLRHSTPLTTFVRYYLPFLGNRVFWNKIIRPIRIQPEHARQDALCYHGPARHQIPSKERPVRQGPREDGLDVL